MKRSKQTKGIALEILGLIALAFIAWTLLQTNDTPANLPVDKKLPIERTFSETIAAVQAKNKFR